MARKRMPAVFLGHGSPLNAIERNAWTQAWRALGSELPRPEAVLVVSAHWYVPHVGVTAMERPETIHDFGGFPKELYAVRYPAPGAPELAERVASLLQPLDVVRSTDWGLDHGAWSLLVHVLPDADVPVVQLSLDSTQPAAWHFETARQLQALRDEGVLVLGSGNVVHALRAYDWERRDAPPPDWALRFETRVREAIVARDFATLAAAESLGADARRAAPTPDHYLPLLYVLAVAHPEDRIRFPVEGFDGGSISMLGVQVGP